jgi:hypothetical protein
MLLGSLGYARLGFLLGLGWLVIAQPTTLGWPAAWQALCGRCAVMGRNNIG